MTSKLKRSTQEPAQCCALIYERGLEAELHYFPIPRFGQQAFYRTITSYEATRNREAGRHYKWTLSKRGAVPSPRMNLGRVEEWGLSLTFLNEVHPDLPRYHHASLFDFYAAVGYDHRRKSWAPRKTRSPRATTVTPI